MAAYIPVPRDLTKVKSKILFNLTKRQLICFGAAALIGVPSFFLLKKLGNVSLAAMGMIVIMLPLFFLAMYERDGQPLEVIAKHFIETRFIRPKIRPYQTDNYYVILHRQAIAQKEVEKIVFHSEMYDLLIKAWNQEISADHPVMKAFQYTRAQTVLLLLDTMDVITGKTVLGNDHLFLQENGNIWRALGQASSWVQAERNYNALEEMESKLH